MEGVRVSLTRPAVILMKTNSLLCARPLALGLAALLLPAAHAAEPAAPAVGALTLEASPAARFLALAVPAPVAADPLDDTPRRSSRVLQPDLFDRNLSDSFPLHGPVRTPAASPGANPASFPPSAPATTPAPRPAGGTEPTATADVAFDWAVPVVAPVASTSSPAHEGFAADAPLAPACSSLALDASATVRPVVIPTAVGLTPAASLPSDGTVHPRGDHHAGQPVNHPTSSPRLRLALPTQADLPSGVGLDTPFALAPQASAPNATLGPNLVTNPGFETGNFNGYDVSMAISGSNLSVSQNDPHAGRYAAQFSDTAKSYDILSQTLSTTPGASYSLSFYLANSYNNAGGNGFKAEFGSTVLLNQVNSATSGFTLYTYTVTATDTSTNVFFEGYNASGFYALDDISVNAVLPEPGTWAGGALLLVAAGLILRQRQRRSAALPG